MGWTLGDVIVIVTGKSDEARQTVVKLRPIQDGSLYQTLGWENETVKLTGYVVGETDKDALETMTTTGLTYTLSGYGTSYGSFYVSGVTFDRKLTSFQTIRPDLDCASPVFQFTAELFKA